MYKISVAICTYNRERYLPQLFESIRKQTIPREYFELILINNNSPGNTKELFENFIAANPDIRSTYADEFNQGLSFARNTAISKATYPLITFLDDDAFISENYLEEVIRTFETHPDMHALGGKILLHYESIIPAWENKYLNSLLGYFNKGDNSFWFTSRDYPRGSNMAFKTDVFKKIGGFDTNLGRIGKKMTGGEEKELFNRIYASKLNVFYSPDAIVYHCVPVERTTSSFIRKQAIGTGMSERQRTLSQGIISYGKRLVIEAFKWGASFILWGYYLLSFHPAKGTMILAFRWWVSLGLIGKKI